MTNDPFDSGYAAYENGESIEKNPFSQENDNQIWEQWNQGWVRGEEDDTLRMQSYCGGGYSWPSDKVEIKLKINNAEYNCIIDYLIIDEKYYNSTEYHDIQSINCKLIKENIIIDNKDKNDINEELDEEDIEDELELYFDELSEHNKIIISGLLKLN